jgi:arylsulfatase A-like enzyme
LLICVDEMRGDCLSALKHPVVQTPNLDNLFRTGVLFSNAYTSCPSCVPARTALHTGLSARTHGKGGSKPNNVEVYDHMLAGEFAKAGYYTQAVGKMHVSPMRRLWGFHHIELHDGYLRAERRKSEAETDDYVPWLRQRAGSEADFVEPGLDCNSSMVSRPWHLAESLHPTNWVVTRSIDFLRRRDPTMPFFLFMSFVAPHPPLTPPQTYLEQYLTAPIPDCPIGDWADTEDANHGGLNPTAFRGIVNQAMLRQAKAGYYGLITQIDHQIGRFLVAMNEFGVRNNTIILFISDHGDMMGDHHFFRKGLPYEGSAKIPFLLFDPTGALKLKKGCICDDPVELMDVMPTLLDAAGIPIPDTVEGSSVLPLARGDHETWREYVLGEYDLGILPHYYLTDGKEKYIWLTRSGKEQLFNLLDDPQECVNLAVQAGCTDRLLRWRQRLVEELKDRKEGYSDGQRLLPGKGGA